MNDFASARIIHILTEQRVPILFQILYDLDTFIPRFSLSEESFFPNMLLEKGGSKITCIILAKNSSYRKVRNIKII